MGERFRKATPAELKWYSGAFLFIPIWGALFVHIGHSYLNNASAIGVWFYLIACLLVAGTSLATWARFVPATVSWTIGAIVWLVTLSLCMTARV